jgi:hypothetical protein
MLSSTLIMEKIIVREKGVVRMIIMIDCTSVYCEKSIWAIAGASMVVLLCASRISVALVGIPGVEFCIRFGYEFSN